MISNKDYRDKTYEDAGVEKGLARKALVVILALMLALAVTLSSCTSADSSGTSDASGAVVKTAAESSDDAAGKSEMFTDRDLSGDYDESNAVMITLGGSGVSASSSSGVTVNGSTVTITAEGVYVVSGTLSDGQIIVDADDAAKVQIVLKDANITSSDSAALYVKSADKVFVTTAAGTDNTLANGGSFTADGDTNVDGAVFAKDDITFNGSGSLTITSPARHGVVGKDDVKFAGGTYTITAAKHGVQANDSVRITQSDISITSGDGKDGIQVSDDSDEEEGTASDSFFYIADGSLTIAAGDDGINADDAVTIEGGTINITKSNEGIEGLSISISGGDVSVTATDDGLNASGGSGSSSGGNGFKGGMANEGGANGSIVISGGNVHITAGGDGVDSNGSVEIAGGYTVVEGPSSGDTSVLDFNSSGAITGGTFIGTGGAGMAENFTSAEQGLIAVSVGNQSGGSAVTLKDAAGAVIADVTPELDYAVVYISTEDMAQGETYTLTAGTYSESITLTDIMYSTLSGGMRGSFGGGGPRGGMNDFSGEVPEGSTDGMPEGSFDGMPEGSLDGFPNGSEQNRGHMRNGSRGDSFQEDTDSMTGATPGGMTGANPGGMTGETQLQGESV